MDLEIARVSREMYKAFSGLNEGFQDVSCFLVSYFTLEQRNLEIDIPGQGSDCH